MEARGLFGAHVFQGAPDPAVTGRSRPDGGAGEVKVEEHRLAILGQQNVRRFHIQMDDSMHVGDMKRLGEA